MFLRESAQARCPRDAASNVCAERGVAFAKGRRATAGSNRRFSLDRGAQRDWVFDLQKIFSEVHLDHREARDDGENAHRGGHAELRFDVCAWAAR